MQKNKRHNNKRTRFSIVFPIISIIGIGLLFGFSSFYEKSWSYNWTGIREHIRDTVKVAENSGISTGVVGYDGRRPSQFDRRYWIMKHSTISELLKLTEYPNGTIKTIAYEGLIRNPEFDNKTELILRSMNEKDFPIEIQSGCSGTRMYISEYLIDYVLEINKDFPPPAEDPRKKFRLLENDIELILEKYKNQPSLWK